MSSGDDHGPMHDPADVSTTAPTPDGGFRELVQTMPEIVVRYDRTGRITFVNDDFAARTGRTIAEALGHRPFEYDPVRTAEMSEYRACLERVLSTGEPQQTDLIRSRRDGSIDVHRVLFRAERDETGAVIGAYAVGRDVTDLVTARQEASAREREFRSLAENATDFIGRWDTEARRVYVNPALARLMGGTQAEVIGRMSEGGPDGSFSALSEAIRACLADRSSRSVVQRFVGDQGEEQTHEVRLVPEFDATGRLVSVLGIGRDVSEVVQQRDALERAARVDALTGVSTRRVLYERVPTVLAAIPTSGSGIALLLLDLDGFKLVNDRYGHRLGDQILREVGRALTALLGDDDLLVRLGGDEFALVLHGVESPTDASLLAHQARLALTSLSPSDAVRVPPLDACVGIAIAPQDAGDVDTLLAHADMALYDAKRQGRGRVAFFRPELRVAMERRSLIEHALDECVPDTEMCLYLQPICTLDADPHVWGAEALLRWTHPTLGPIAPDEFIPIAEQTGHIVPIGRWVLRRAAEIAVAHNRDRSHPCRIAVNVSTRQFTLDDIGDAVHEAVTATGCDPHWLVLELTESLLLEDFPLVRRSLDALRAIGVAIALDDFGTGYSALHYLSRLRIDHLKVDRSLLRDADVDRQQYEIVRALVALARAMDLDVVAEGIETPGQAALLRQLGCKLGQGYLLSHPLPVDEFSRWINTSPTWLRATLPA